MRRRGLLALALVLSNISGSLRADEGPLPLFLAPRVAADESLSPETRQAIDRRQRQRAIAVSNPNLRWKPHRVTAEQAQLRTLRDEQNAVQQAAAYETNERHAVRQAQAVEEPAEQSVARRATRIADNDQPQRRVAKRASRSKFRNEILRVAADDKTDPFSSEFDNEMDLGEELPPAEEAADEAYPPRGRTRTSRPQADEPRPISPLDEAFPEEAMPAPGGDSDSGYGTGGGEEFVPNPANQAPTPVSCDADKRECANALNKLKSTGINKISIGVAVNGLEGTDFPCECVLTGKFQDRNWCCSTFTWKASALCHKPLYFEEVQLERYGHSLNPLIQPLWSGLHFFLLVPVLPYMMGMDPPNECQYVLGYYRPGECAPYLVPPLPLSLRGAVVEGIFAGSLVAILP